MLYLKKKGFALINTVIIISLITTLGSFVFKLIENNRNMDAVHYIDEDIFSVDSNEEELIYEFMKILNKKSDDVEVETTDERETGESIKEDMDEKDNNKIGMIKKSIKEVVFHKDFQEAYENGRLIYKKDTDSLELAVTGKYDALRIRELRYIIRKNKVILIPTTNFIDTNTMYMYQ